MTIPEFETVPSIDKLNELHLAAKRETYIMKIWVSIENTIKSFSSSSKRNKRFAGFFARTISELIRLTATDNGHKRFIGPKKRSSSSFKFTSSERTRFRNLKKLLDEMTTTDETNIPELFFVAQQRSKNSLSGYDYPCWRLHSHCIKQLSQVDVPPGLWNSSPVCNIINNALSDNVGWLRNNLRAMRGSGAVWISSSRGYRHLSRTIELADMIATTAENNHE
jgi:hypothetical protein